MASVRSFNFKTLVALDSLCAAQSSSERELHLESNVSLLLLGKINKSFSKKNSPKQSNLRDKKRDH